MFNSLTAIRRAALIALGAAIGFLAVLLAVRLSAAALRIDAALAALAQHRVGGRTQRLMELVSASVSEGAPPLFGGGLVLLLVLRRWRTLALWLVTIGGGLIALQLTRVLLRASRPAFADPLRLRGFWQFPSGHVVTAVLCAGLLAALCARRAPHWRGPLWACAALYVALVGLSRVQLGVHYPSDVLAGYGFGAAWVSGWLALLPIPREPEAPSPQRNEETKATKI